jgi:hypothetical protein
LKSMAGSKTRFGFLGSGEEPPESGEPGSARTVLGHDIHLQKLPSGIIAPETHPKPAPVLPAHVPVTPLPRAAVTAPMQDSITEPVPRGRRYTPRQSRLARFLGRWTKSGRFESRSRLGDSGRMDDFVDDDLEVPRDTTGRNVLLFLAVALLTFLVTFAIVKLRQGRGASQSAASYQVMETRSGQMPASPAPAPSAASPVRLAAPASPAAVPPPSLPRLPP